jgi:hypothetical protein
MNTQLVHWLNILYLTAALWLRKSWLRLLCFLLT